MHRSYLRFEFIVIIMVLFYRIFLLSECSELYRRMTEISDTRTRNTRWPCIPLVVVADDHRVVVFVSSTARFISRHTIFTSTTELLQIHLFEQHSIEEILKYFAV